MDAALPAQVDALPVQVSLGEQLRNDVVGSLTRIIWVFDNIIKEATLNLNGKELRHLNSCLEVVAITSIFNHFLEIVNNLPINDADFDLTDLYALQEHLQVKKGEVEKLGQYALENERGRNRQ
uniref:Mediator of RNA polymerase II transcription subunit 22 n=1 Tax=Meloidogyne hapla TaxID=6305 RepID=A0A1I8BYK2_MELHA